MNKVPITSVCDFIGGTQPPKNEWVKYQKDGFIRMLQIRDFTQSDENFIEYVKNKSNLKTCKSEDILIGRYGASVGKILSGLSGAYNVAIIKTAPNPSKLHRNYLKFILLSRNFQHFIKNVGTRAAQAGFNKTDLNDFFIPLPPLETQKKIAEILDAADTLRQKTKTLIEKYDQLTQSLFLDMFGNLGLNSERWKKACIENCTTKIGSGATPLGGKESYYAKGISLIRSMNVHDGYFKYDSLAFINQEQAKKLNNVIVEKHDVLFNITGASVCRSTIVPVNVLPARVNQHVAILRPNKKIINHQYLNSILISKSIKNKLLGIGSKGGATREAITKKQLAEFEIPLPPLPLQNQFAERVQTIEEQKVKAQVSLEKSEELFQSLLQRAYKGEIN